jgi:hypothetical protein
VVDLVPKTGKSCDLPVDFQYCLALMQLMMCFGDQSRDEALTDPKIADKRVAETDDCLPVQSETRIDQ